MIHKANALAAAAFHLSVMSAGTLRAEVTAAAGDPKPHPVLSHTTFFALATGLGGASYSGAYANGTEITGSGLMLINSLQGGFFVSQSLAIGAGGAFLYMPEPAGTRRPKGGRMSTSGDVAAAPGGFLGAAIRYYATEAVHLSVVAGYGGMGTFEQFGGTGPALAPSVGVDLYSAAHYRLGAAANLYFMPLSSPEGESGSLMGGGAVVALAYL